MKYVPTIVGALLGLLFVVFGSLFFFMTPPPIPEGTPMWHFMTAVIPTGFMNYVKCFEILGGLLVAIPKTRNFGLLVLGPIILNIVAFHTFITKGEGLVNPILIFICLASLYLLWTDRKAFLALLR